MGGSAYVGKVKAIFDQDLGKEETIGEIAGLCETITDNAYKDGKSEAQESRDNRLQDDLHAAQTEWREIVESFNRRDMTDVRSRLMNMGTRVFNVDVWIPNR